MVCLHKLPSGGASKAAYNALLEQLVQMHNLLFSIWIAPSGRALPLSTQSRWFVQKKHSGGTTAPSAERVDNHVTAAVTQERAHDNQNQKGFEQGIKTEAGGGGASTGGRWLTTPTGILHTN